MLTMDYKIIFFLLGHSIWHMHPPAHIEGSGYPEGAGQGRRNRGAWRAQVLPSALFPGAKCPFLAWKVSLRLHYFWKLESMLFPENFFHFREKYHVSGKLFGISWNFFLIFRKKCGISKFIRKFAPQIYIYWWVEICIAGPNRRAGYATGNGRCNLQNGECNFSTSGKRRYVKTTQGYVGVLRTQNRDFNRSLTQE
jgi:hypothetical protein